MLDEKSTIPFQMDGWIFLGLPGPCTLRGVQDTVKVLLFYQ
jgi:hypothetical protein